ncbi:hypothetical protein, partial [Actinoplanes campanulatus]|uniref:hypothetical protein n=1 Tax=Actinoplanes campanulatus TaxID=113559 RepID=UPI001953BD78
LPTRPMAVGIARTAACVCGYGDQRLRVRLPRSAASVCGHRDRRFGWERAPDREGLRRWGEFSAVMGGNAADAGGAADDEKR